MFADENDGFSRKRRAHENVHIDFTPMIDCMFLLLMFNMIAFVLTGRRDLDLPTAKFAKGNDDSNSFVIVLRQPKQEGGAARLEVEGKPELTNASMEELNRAIGKSLAEGKQTVVLKAEKKVLIGSLMEVAAQTNGVEGLSILLAVRHED